MHRTRNAFLKIPAGMCGAISGKVGSAAPARSAGAAETLLVSASFTGRPGETPGLWEPLPGRWRPLLPGVPGRAGSSASLRASPSRPGRAGAGGGRGAAGWRRCRRLRRGAGAPLRPPVPVRVRCRRLPGGGGAGAAIPARAPVPRGGSGGLAGQGPPPGGRVPPRGQGPPAALCAPREAAAARLGVRWAVWGAPAALTPSSPPRGIPPAAPPGMLGAIRALPLPPTGGQGFGGANRALAGGAAGCLQRAARPERGAGEGGLGGAGGTGKRGCGQALRSFGKPPARRLESPCATSPRATTGS